MTKKQKEHERKEAVARLKEWVKEGDTVYTMLKHVSESGMSRVIDCKVLRPNDRGGVDVLHIGYNVAKALDWGYNEDKGGVKVGGCGMDMGFHLVYTLGSVLFNDGYKINHEWL